MKMLCVNVAVCLAVTAASRQVLNEDLKLLASDGAASDRFGWSIAIDNGVVAVGAWFDADNGTESGSAYVFDAVTGVQIAKLLPSDGAAGHSFGYSIAIDNGIVAVGANFDGDDADRSGSAYLFDASTGAQLFKLLPSDVTLGDEFGYSIALDNGVVAVGAAFDDDNGPSSGSVYLFDVVTGAQIAKLLPSDMLTGLFGSSIAIDNGVVAVGASWSIVNGFSSGSAYLFDVSTGAQLAKLLPSDGAEDDEFGRSIAIDNGVVAVGAWFGGDNANRSGSAYLFDASTGAQLFKLLASDGAAIDFFGWSIAIANGVVAVGAFFDDDNGPGSGSAYLFDASTGAQIAKLLPSDGSALDIFGFSIAMDEGVVAVGAWGGDNDNGSGSGSAYVFDLTTLPCPGDIADGSGVLGPDGMVSFGDFMAMLSLVGPCPGMTPGCDGDIADDFGTLPPLGGADGMVSFGDFLALLGLVGPCP